MIPILIMPEDTLNLSGVKSDLPAGATPISQSDLTPAELSELGAGIPAGATPIDPVAELSAPELAELQVGKLFDPIAWADSNQHKAFEPATLQKLSEAHDIVTSRGLGGFVVGDIGAVQSAKEGKPIEAVSKVVKPVAETVFNMAKWFGSTLAEQPMNAGMAGVNALFGGDPGTTNELLKQAAKGEAENVAGVESALFTLADTGKKLLRPKSLEEIRNERARIAAGEPAATDETKKQKFLSDLGMFQQKQKIGTGQGEFAQTEGTSAEDMAKIGVTLDPTIIAERASGDPFSFVAFGKAFQAITPAGKLLATIPGVAQLSATAKALTSRGLIWAAETGVDLTGKTITKAGQTAGLAGKLAPATGTVTGLVKGGPLGALAGLKTGEIAARGFEKTAVALKNTGTAISDFSKNLATEAGPVGSYTQLARDIIGAAPGVLADTAKGAGLDLGFAAAVSETPQDTEGMATFGTTFGALHGAASAGRRVVQGQALAPRPWGTTEKTKPYGNFANLDAAHAAAEQSRAPAEVQRADAIRAFAANLPGGAEAYLMPNTAAFESFLVDDYARKTGAAPVGAALDAIKSNAQTKGMFSAELLDDSGQKRKVILLNDVDAAPHEAAHAIQDVIGAKANEVVDALVKDTYAGTWESEGENYARRLAPSDARPWRDVIVDRTGWKDADTFLARELAAENFDVAFKNKGGDFGRGDTLPEKLARIAARTSVFFGSDPYAGAKTQGLKVQPKVGVIEAVKGQAELAKQTPPVLPTAPVAPIVTPKATPGKPTVTPTAPKAPAVPTSSASGVSPDAKAAQNWAASKNDPRLVNIVNSIVANQVRSAPGEAAPIRLKYLSVAGEEAATRTPRRSEQEAAYLKEALGAMPAETRQEVEKTHAHVRFDPVKKGNEMQSIGYSLEKLVENAQRAAKWLAGNDAARPVSPYEIDPATGSFTPDAWKQLVSDIQTYTVNQQAGGTGAGKALVQPANAAELKISVPPVQATKFAPLEQSKADFINTLMGFKLPETTRVSRAGGTPGNIVGQDISKANEQPFIQPRISEPAVQRGGGKEFPGFAGRSIKEVNPIRKQLEAAGFPVNELTEVVERVNLKHLESATPAPEVQFRPGVTDTIRAGFQPSEYGPVREKEKIAEAARERLDSLVGRRDASERERREWREADEAYGEALTALRISIQEAPREEKLKAGFLPPEERSKENEPPRGIVSAGLWTSKLYDAFSSAPKDIFKDEAFVRQIVEDLPIEQFQEAGGTEAVKTVLDRLGSGDSLLSLYGGDTAITASEWPIVQNAIRLWKEKTQPNQTIPKNEFVSKEQAAREVRAGLIRRFGEKKADKILADRQKSQFLPAEDEAKIVENLDSAGFTRWSKEQPGGLTSTAHRIGRQAKTQEFTDSLNTRAQGYRDEAKKLLDSGDFNAVTPIVMKGQFFREAWEAATGTGSAGEFLKQRNPDYIPPFPSESKSAFLPNAEVKKVADEYAKAAGMKPAKFEMRPVNEALAKRLADFYDEAKHSPDDPAVKKSYQALADETLAQYKAMTEAGYTIEPYEGKGEPYKNSAEMMADVQDNKHLFFLRTEGNFSGENNPMLAPSGIKINGSELAVNDVFRAVHDFFGHATEGLQFGPKGEFNAWRVHSEMYSPEAQGALAAETLAQNSFVNFGKHLRDEAGNIPDKGEPGYVALPDRKFAEQKNVVVPSKLIAEAKTQFSPKDEEDPYAKYNVDYDKAVAKRKAGKKSGLTGWILPDNNFVPLDSELGVHEDYLAGEAKDLNKKFGTNFSEKTNVHGRQDALNAGFIRMRKYGGTMHVESGQAGWTKAARDKVFETVADNLDDIDQIQVSLLDKNGIVKRSGHERLMDYDTDAEKLDHLPLISEGGRGSFLPAENENLPGMEVGREFNRAAINQMNKAELRSHFPEAIIPRANDELINSNIVGSPLAKQEGGRAAGIEAFANTLADFYKEIKDQPEAKAGASWYSDFTPRLKKEFGKDAPIMAELLAATSPQTNPQVNFGYAFDALEGFKSGKYDRQIAKFKEGLDKLEDGSLAKVYERDLKAGKVNNPPEKPSDSTYLAHWIDKHDLVPLGSSGKRFGTHSIRVLQVLSRKWLAMNAGPKTSNFVQNLLGTGHEATIDLWADRTMRRIGYSGYEDRWRILPENSTGVSDEDFAFSQEAFRAAAKKLGIKPSALQGALWFGEKRLWADKGWGRLDLGDYRDELKKVALLRAGIKQREEATKLGKKAGSAEQEALDLGLQIEPRNAKLKP